MVSTVWRWLSRAATSSAATLSSPASTSVRGAPLTIVFESARSFWLKVSRAASTTARKVWKPASVGVTSKVTRVTPASRSTGCVLTRAPSANRRTVAGCATVERISATASIDSPRFAVDGVVSRSTRTSSIAPGPIRRVSIRTPWAAASAASAWPPPVVSLPSESSTIRFWASSGKSAVARRSAAPMSVADVTGIDAIRSISVSSDGRRSTSACLPNATIPATSPSGLSAERLAQEREGVLAPGVADRVGQVDDEDGRQPVDRQDELEAGQREDERRQQRRPDEQRDPAPPRAQVPARRQVQSEGEGEGRDQQQQRERRVERDPHQALPPAGRRPNRSASSRRSRTTASRW